MSKYIIPSMEEFGALVEAHNAEAVTVYVNTVNEVNHHIVEQKLATALKNTTKNSVLHDNFHGAVAHCESLVGGSTVALFVTQENAKVFVLPNKLVEDIESYDHVNLRHLFRTVTFMNSGFMLVIERDGWELYEATRDTRAKKVLIDKTGIENITDANNRDSIRNRDHERKLHGDERFDPLQYIYAKRVAEAINNYFNDKNLNRAGLVFIVAGTDELTREYWRHSRLHSRNTFTHVEANLLTKNNEEIDERMRVFIEIFNSSTVVKDYEDVLDLSSSGRVVLDLSEAARAITNGNVQQIIFDFEESIAGSYDPHSGEIDYGDSGDLLNELVIHGYLVGSRILAARVSELGETFESSHFIMLKRY